MEAKVCRLCNRVAEIEEAAIFAAFGGCFRSLHGGRGAFVLILYDAFVVDRLFYMACGPRTYGKLTVCHFTRKFAAGWKTNLPR